MNTYKEQIHDYVYGHRNEIISELTELIKIPSVRGEKEENAPFGIMCANVLKYTQKLYEKEGIETELDENGGYLLSYSGEGEKSIGIFAHADVVPVADDWILTNPFEPLEKDGYVVGRGALDNKSAVIASLYCAKMLKDLNIQLKNRLVLFTGSNEESGMQDIRNYLMAHKKPDFSLVPDTAFPLYRGNKGRITFSVKGKKPLSEGVSINGGTGATVIGGATAVVPFEKALFDEIQSLCNERISAEKQDENIIIKATGIAKHSALPEGSLSAVFLLCDALKRCRFLKQVDKDIFEQISNFAGYYYGEFFEIESEDKEFGKLTCVLTKITTDEDGMITADFNIRYGLSINKDTVVFNITKKAEEIGWKEPEFAGFTIPQCIPDSNVFVQSLLEVYKNINPLEGTKSRVNAGGTYRQYLQDGVEIGPTNQFDAVEGLPQGHGGAHQPDECILIDGFMEAIEIMMNMILECDKILEDM